MADELPTGDKAIFAFCEIFALAFAFEGTSTLLHGEPLWRVAGAFMAAVLFFLLGIKWSTLKAKLKASSRAAILQSRNPLLWLGVGTVSGIFLYATTTGFIGAILDTKLKRVISFAEPVDFKTASGQPVTPALFTYLSGTTSYVAAVHLDGKLVGPTPPSSRPAVPGEVIEIYGTCFGATTPPTTSSQLFARAGTLIVPVSVSVGGTLAEVQWAGLVSSGLYQLNVKVPNVGAGDQPIRVRVAGFHAASNASVAVAKE